MKSRVHRCLKALEAAKTCPTFAREMETDHGRPGGHRRDGRMSKASPKNTGTAFGPLSFPFPFWNIPA